MAVDQGSYKAVDTGSGASTAGSCCAGALAAFLLVLFACGLGLLIWSLASGSATGHSGVGTFDCVADYANWKNAWDQPRCEYCCEQFGRACAAVAPEKRARYAHYEHAEHTEGHVGTAHGRIYDCGAGYSNWMQGWSDSKKDWCCDKEKKGCVKYHCSGTESAWGAQQSAWCCENFQKACPKTTLSPQKCNTPCTIEGKTSTCIERIHWTADHVFNSKDEKCALAYSKVQVECDVCRACSIQEAGCSVHAAASDPFDCAAALNNFFRAWSPEKKHWCCTKQGRGCEGSSPPAVDAGAGMVWKHAKVNGYWTWQSVPASAPGTPSPPPPPPKPYDCHAGVENAKSGWSVGKKDWCCDHEKVCPDQP